MTHFRPKCFGFNFYLTKLHQSGPIYYTCLYGMTKIEVYQSIHQIIHIMSCRYGTEKDSILSAFFDEQDKARSASI
jgi:hypothetical protein